MATLSFSPNAGLLFLDNDTREKTLDKGLFSNRDCLFHDHTCGKSDTQKILEMFGKPEVFDVKFGDSITVVEHINPYMCLINYKLVIYFGEDKPILKSKCVKSCTTGYKKWTGYNWKNPKEKEKYYYLDVKEPEKIFIFGNTYHFDGSNFTSKHETIEVVDGQYITKFDMSNQDWTKAMQLKIENDRQEKIRQEEYQRELERRKSTPGYCSRCGAEHAQYTVDPFDAEMNGNYTQVWLCGDCYDDLLGDI